MTAPTIVTSSGRESVAVRAVRIVAERRLTIVGLHRGRVTARCRGTEQSYNLGFNPDQGWWCHCAEPRGRCAHIAALKLVIDPSEEREP